MSETRALEPPERDCDHWGRCADPECECTCGQCPGKVKR